VGVTPTAKSRKLCKLRPQIVGNINEVRTSYVAAWGPVESNWRLGATQTEYEFTIPANAQATVELRTASPDALRIDGAAAGDAPGVVSSKMKPEKIELILGSGHYRMAAPNPR